MASLRTPYSSFGLTPKHVQISGAYVVTEINEEVPKNAFISFALNSQFHCFPVLIFSLEFGSLSNLSHLASILQSPKVHILYFQTQLF